MNIILWSVFIIGPMSRMDLLTLLIRWNDGHQSWFIIGAAEIVFDNKNYKGYLTHCCWVDFAEVFLKL